MSEKKFDNSILHIIQYIINYLIKKVINKKYIKTQKDKIFNLF